MNVIGSLILILLLLLVLFSPRRLALLAMTAGILYLTQAQEVTIFGFNLFAFRFVELAAFFRVVLRSEVLLTKLTRIDRCFIALYAVTTLIFLLRSKDGQAYEIGTAADALFSYFAFRGLIGEGNDFQLFLRSLLFLLAPYAVLTLIESVSRHNPFNIIGGIESQAWVREGRIRCWGSFRHPSLLGTLGATFMPCYFALTLTSKGRFYAVVGMISCLSIVWASNSGGPLNCLVVGVVGWLFWRIRTKMSLVRRTMLVLILVLSSLMKAPIWYLPAKVSSITGGDGWHRSYLMDVAFQHFDLWGLSGLPILATQGWFPYDLAETGGADITNQFLSFGLESGIFGIFLFILLLVQAFKALGRALSEARSEGAASSDRELILWALGVTLLVHIFNWLGITYFDQTYAIWFLQLAAIANLTTASSTGPTHSGLAPAFDDIQPKCMSQTANTACLAMSPFVPCAQSE